MTATNELPLGGKTALVTGASRGIGRAIALHLAGLGADVIVNYLRNESAASEVTALIERIGRRGMKIQADVGRPKAIKKMFEAIRERFESVDVLVHNAALGTFKPITEIQVFHWNISLDVNARALLLLAKEALPLMEKRGGAIIGISSLGSQRVIPSYGAIGVSKAALESLIRYLAVELAPKGIRVNGVSGGLVDTEALSLHPSYEELKQEGVQRTPAGRIGTPDDIASVVSFLADDRSKWIYGHTIVADGGLSLV